MSLNIRSKMFEGSKNNHSLHQRPENSQLELKNAIDWCQYRGKADIGIIWQKIKVVIIKMPQLQTILK